MCQRLLLCEPTCSSSSSSLSQARRLREVGCRFPASPATTTAIAGIAVFVQAVLSAVAVMAIVIIVVGVVGAERKRFLLSVVRIVAYLPHSHDTHTNKQAREVMRGYRSRGTVKDVQAKLLILFDLTSPCTECLISFPWSSLWSSSRSKLNF